MASGLDKQQQLFNGTPTTRNETHEMLALVCSMYDIMLMSLTAMQARAEKTRDDQAVEKARRDYEWMTGECRRLDDELVEATTCAEGARLALTHKEYLVAQIRQTLTYAKRHDVATSGGQADRFASVAALLGNAIDILADDMGLEHHTA